MPRLAPDGVRCKETRLTTGNMERKLLALYISEQKKERIQKYISSFAWYEVGTIRNRSKQDILKVKHYFSIFQKTYRIYILLEFLMQDSY